MNENTTGLQLQDAASPEALLPDHGPWPWWTWTILLALILGVALYLVRRKSKPSAVDPRKMRETAFHEAMAALTGIQSDDPRHAAVQSSLILRRYLSIAAADPALYETHEEFIARNDALEALADSARAAAASSFSRLAALKYGPEIPGTPSADIIAESRHLLETLHHGFTA